MKISLLIASRGRPVDLLATLIECDDHVHNHDDTSISVALDWDDDTNPVPPTIKSKLKWSVSDREDSLGAKYNRCATNAPADVYVLGADDNVFITPGWDEKIREVMRLYPDNFGFCYFGRLDGTLPVSMAISHHLLEAQSFLFPPFWPVWFHDTWTDEIAHMCGRIIWADIEVKEIGGRGKSRGVRDIAFWAGLFDALRPQRIMIADALSQKFNPEWIKVQMAQRSNILNLFMQDRIARLRNPATANQFERRMSFDAPADERYMRIKSQAEALLADLVGKAA